ncbi:MAG: DUF2244 domain-containing protein [Pseudomonadota bacterium]|nr:MAG: DUF2244 domain-containing protein [Pseudomonadota bacterium]
MGIFFAGTAAVSITIATGFALAGAWPILPFAGMEMLLLGLALQMCTRKARRFELIAIDEDRIEIRRHAGGPRESFSFQRYWAQVTLVPPMNRSQASRLLIRSHGRSVEVGSWLDEQERRELASGLLQTIGHSGACKGHHRTGFSKL